MLISPKNNSSNSCFQLNILKNRAQIIKDKSFHLALGNQSYQPSPLHIFAKVDTISHMLTKLTKKIKSQLKEERDRYRDACAASEEEGTSEWVVGRPLSLKTKQSQIDNKLTQYHNKYNSQNGLNYTDVDLKSRAKQKSRNNSRSSSRRSTLSNLKQRIWKGSTLSRLNYQPPNTKKQITKTKTQQNSRSQDPQFIPVGNMLNKSSHYLLNSSPQQLTTSKPTKQQQLQQIYNQIFIRYPNRTHLDHAKQRPTRYTHRFSSWYRANREQPDLQYGTIQDHEDLLRSKQVQMQVQVQSEDRERDRERERVREREMEREREREKEHKEKEKEKDRRKNSKNKHVCVSLRKINCRVGEQGDQEGDDLRESSLLGSIVLGPWKNQKI